MGLIIQHRALQAAGDLRQILPVVRKRDKSLFAQIHRDMNSVVLNIAEAGGNDPGTAKARFASACGSAKEVRAGLQLAVAYG
jgi:four helix bundle protein